MAVNTYNTLLIIIIVYHDTEERAWPPGSARAARGHWHLGDGYREEMLDGRLPKEEGVDSAQKSHLIHFVI